MLSTTYIKTSFGHFKITGSGRGVQQVKLVEYSKADLYVPPFLWDCAEQLKEYFQGKRRIFDLKLDWEGKSKFNQQVWRELLKIPYGHTTSYSKIAERLNNPKAVRAVGLANKNNPIAIIVPCHRVVAKNGNLQGYFYGLEMKRKLLELENPMSFSKQGSLFG